MARHRKLSRTGRSDIEGISSSSSLLVWVVAALITAVSCYRLATLPYTESNEIWIRHLFSEYTPPQSQYIHLLESKNAAALNTTELATIWDPPVDFGWKQCVEEITTTATITETTTASAAAQRTPLLQISCTGGLFQLHICVCNAVAVAKLLNSTLLIPYFREYSFWDDPSKFEDIYDVDYFISYLKGDLQVVKELPAEYKWSTPEYYQHRCLERPNCVTYLPKHATVEWYLNNVYPIMQSYGVVIIEGFEHKLTFEDLPRHITKIRCRTNFHALRFVQPIRDLAKKLVMRMRKEVSNGSVAAAMAMTPTSTTPPHLNKEVWWKLALTSIWNGKKRREMVKEVRLDVTRGRFVGLHVRFEKDMVAHSACDYGGGRAEQNALASFRYHKWRNRVQKAQYSADELLKNGSCPLTPEEMGLLLASFGFKSTLPIYIAGKESYGGGARLKPLKDIFPVIESKYSLASQRELNPFLAYSHKLAAVDFLVLLESDVFMSNAAGNFPNVLSGQRSYFGSGKSIHPDKAFLAMIFGEAKKKKKNEWMRFAEEVVRRHNKMRMGDLLLRKYRHSVFRVDSFRAEYSVLTEHLWLDGMIRTGENVVLLRC